MSRSLKGMNIPKQYQEGINSLIETALYIEQDSWHENDVTFSTGKGGEAKTFKCSPIVLWVVTGAKLCSLF